MKKIPCFKNQKKKIHFKNLKTLKKKSKFKKIQNEVDFKSIFTVYFNRCYMSKII